MWHKPETITITPENINKVFKEAIKILRAKSVSPQEYWQKLLNEYLSNNPSWEVITRFTLEERSKWRQKRAAPIRRRIRKMQRI